MLTLASLCTIAMPMIVVDIPLSGYGNVDKEMECIESQPIHLAIRISSYTINRVAKMLLFFVLFLFAIQEWTSEGMMITLC